MDCGNDCRRKQLSLAKGFQDANWPAYNRSSGRMNFGDGLPTSSPEQLCQLLCLSMLFRTNYSAERRWPRQWWNSSVEVFTKSAQVKALGMNISVGGMGLFAVANLHVGSPIEIEFQSPESGKRHRLRGIVRHRALYLYGIEFVNKPQFVAASSAAR